MYLCFMYEYKVLQIVCIECNVIFWNANVKDVLLIVVGLELKSNSLVHFIASEAICSEQLFCMLPEGRVGQHGLSKPCNL